MNNIIGTMDSYKFEFYYCITKSIFELFSSILKHFCIRIEWNVELAYLWLIWGAHKKFSVCNTLSCYNFITHNMYLSKSCTNNVKSNIIVYLLELHDKHKVQLVVPRGFPLSIILFHNPFDL